MSLKDTLKSTADSITEGVKHAAKDVQDATSEALHRGSADAEREKREVAGDTMTTGEKVGSVAREGKERVLAEADRAKRTIRDNT